MVKFQSHSLLFLMIYFLDAKFTFQPALGKQKVTYILFTAFLLLSTRHLFDRPLLETYRTVSFSNAHLKKTLKQCNT